MGRELLGRDDVRVIVTRPDDTSIRASERMMTKAGSAWRKGGSLSTAQRRSVFEKKAQYDAKNSGNDAGLSVGRVYSSRTIPLRLARKKGRIALE